MNSDKVDLTKETERLEKSLGPLVSPVSVGLEERW